MYLLTVGDECDAYFVKYKMHIEYAKSFCIFFQLSYVLLDAVLDQLFPELDFDPELSPFLTS